MAVKSKVTFRYVRSLVIEGCRDDAHKKAVEDWMEARQLAIMRYKNYLTDETQLIAEWTAAATAYKLATGDPPPYGILSRKRVKWRLPKRLANPLEAFTVAIDKLGQKP